MREIRKTETKQLNKAEQCAQLAAAGESQVFPSLTRDAEEGMVHMLQGAPGPDRPRTRVLFSDTVSKQTQKRDADPSGEEFAETHGWPRPPWQTAAPPPHVRLLRGWGSPPAPPAHPWGQRRQQAELAWSS